MMMPSITTGAVAAYTGGTMKDPRIVSVNLRMPEDLHADLTRVAKDQDRSLTAQINRFLREAVERYRREHPELEQDQSS